MLNLDLDTELLGIVDLPENIEFTDEEPKEEKTIEKKLLRCPCCGHINEEKAFKNYEDS